MLPPRPAQVMDLAPGIRRILAPNSSPMTYWGTNTYLVGDHDVAVIDPGPNDPAHLSAIVTALPQGGEITHILVSHAHRDHSPAARPLAEQTGAPVLAFGTATAGRSEVMQDLAQRGLAGGGEGVDADFVPDATLADGDRVSGAGWTLEAMHTPGHMGNHLSFALGDDLFCGDLVMGWSSSLVSPPDGDLTDFMASCRRLRARAWHRFLPGHGDPIETPRERLDWLITHRMGREQQILEALRAAPATPDALAQLIYVDTPPALLGAAARNVFAHLVDLTGRGEVEVQSQLSPEAIFRLARARAEF